MTERYTVIIFTGSPSPDYVRSIGLFATPDDASDWCDSHGYPQTPGQGKWAIVVPQEQPGADA